MLLTFIELRFSRGVKKPQAGVKIMLLNALLTFIGLFPNLLNSLACLSSLQIQKKIMFATYFWSNQK